MANFQAHKAHRERLQICSAVRISTHVYDHENNDENLVPHFVKLLSPHTERSQTTSDENKTEAGTLITEISSQHRKMNIEHADDRK